MRRKARDRTVRCIHGRHYTGTERRMDLFYFNFWGTFQHKPASLHLHWNAGVRLEWRRTFLGLDWHRLALLRSLKLLLSALYGKEKAVWSAGPTPEGT